MGTRSKMSKTIIFQIFTPPHGVKGDITTCHAIRIIKAIPGTANSTIPTGKVRRNRNSSGDLNCSVMRKNGKETSWSSSPQVRISHFNHCMINTNDSRKTE